MKFLTIAMRLAVCTALAVPLTAQAAMTGQLVDPQGVGIAGATFVFSNGGPTVNTGVNGTFTITGLRDRGYDVQIDPRRNDVAPATRSFNLSSGTNNVGLIQLDPGAEVSGTFQSPSGGGLLGGNAAAFLPDGTKLFTPHNGMDLQGWFSIVVPLGEIDIRVVPPVGSSYVPYFARHNITGPLTLGTKQLEQGYQVTGSIVSGSSLLPISGAEVLTYDALTETEHFQANKRANTFGAFSLLLPRGLHRFEIIPPLGSTHQGFEIFNVAVLGNMNMGQIALEPAVVLQGIVRDSAGLPVAGVDIDVITTDGYKIYTTSDNTIATGQFGVLVPQGNYSVRVDPLPGSGLVGVKTAPFTVSGPTNIGVITLQQGVPLALQVVDGLGNGIPGVDLDLFDAASGEEIIVAGDVTAADGTLTVTVLPGTYDLELDAPQGSSFGRYTQSGVTVTAGTNLSITMADKILVTDLTTLGTPGISFGGFPVNLSFHVRQPNALPTQIEFFVQLPDNTEIPLITPVTLDLFPGLAITFGGIWIPSPPVPAGQDNRVVRLVTRYTDPVSGDLLDFSSIRFAVQ